MVRETPEINGGSLADIAFLLLIFFLVTTTMDVDKGITRLLPPEMDQPDPATPVNRRNIMIVLINKSDRLSVDGQEFPAEGLREKVMEFFSNPSELKTLPVMEESIVEFPPGSSSLLSPDGIWKGKVSKGVISLQNDRSTSYGRYIEIQDEIVAGINELRESFCQRHFHSSFAELNTNDPIEKSIYDGIRQIYKMSISEAEPKQTGGTENE